MFAQIFIFTVRPAARKTVEPEIAVLFAMCFMEAFTPGDPSSPSTSAPPLPVSVTRTRVGSVLKFVLKFVSEPRVPTYWT